MAAHSLTETLCKENSNQLPKSTQRDYEREGYDLTNGISTPSNNLPQLEKNLGVTQRKPI